MNKLSLFQVVLALSLLPACSEPSASAPSPAPEITEPSVTDVETVFELRAAPDGAIGVVAAASAGDGGAIVFAQAEGFTGEFYTQTRVKLQRLDKTGAALGAPTELAVIPSNNGLDDVSRVTLASDGKKYIACWGGSNTKISCASTPVVQGERSPALSIEGRWPSLAYGPEGLALGYTVAEKMAVLYLDDAGMAAGDAVLFDGSDDASAEVFLAATPTGFALLGESGGSMYLHFIDDTLSLPVAPIDLGQMYWFHGSLAASGTKIAVSLGYPYEGKLFLIDNETLTETRSFVAEAGKTGLNATLGVEGSSLGMLTADSGFGLHYGAVDEQGTEAPKAFALDAEIGAYTGGSLAITNLHGETFVIATQGIWKKGGKLVVAWARRPM